MFRRNTFAILCAWSAFAVLPAFSQEEFYRQEVTGQAFGSFVSETTQDSIKQKASDSGGALANYRYFFNKNQGLEADYGYSVNTQSYSGAGTALGVKSYSNEVTAAYVYRFPFNRWSFFALGGTGAIVFDAKDMPGVGSQARAVGVYGGGVDADITSHLFVRAQYRGLVYNSPTYDLSALARMDRVTQRFEPSLGFGWRF
jgi:opacity protein-like surface antigen